MTDLNVMMREQALTGLNRELDEAVTNGDAEAARKVTDKIARLAVASAPKAPAFNDADITAELEKADWFGVDPEKSAKVVEYGKTMNPKKFGTAAEFAKALIKAVEDKFKPAAPAAGEGADDEGTDGEGTDDDAAGDDEGEGKPAPKKRRTDGPGEGDANARGVARRSGPWTKLSDAPANIQAEINRTANKLLSSSAPKEQREKFVTRALESHYAQHQRTKGKK